MGSVLVKLLEWRNEITVCPHGPSIRARLLNQRKCSVAITGQFTKDEVSDEANSNDECALHHRHSRTASTTHRPQASEAMSSAYVDPTPRSSPRRRGGESNEARADVKPVCNNSCTQNELSEEKTMSYGFFTMPCDAATTGYCQIHYPKRDYHHHHNSSHTFHSRNISTHAPYHSPLEPSTSSVHSCAEENESDYNNNDAAELHKDSVKVEEENEEECLGTLDCADAFMYFNASDERVYQERESVVYRAPCVARYTSTALRTRYQTTAVPQPFLNSKSESATQHTTNRNRNRGIMPATLSATAAQHKIFPSLIAQLQHRWRCQPDRLALAWRVVEQVVRSPGPQVPSCTTNLVSAAHGAAQRDKSNASHETCDANCESCTRCYHMGPPQYMTAGELRAQVRRCAAGLRLIGCVPGDLILLLDETRWEWLVTCYAAWSIGAIVVVLHDAERCLVRALRDTRHDHVRAIVCPSSQVERIRRHYDALQAQERSEDIVQCKPHGLQPSQGSPLRKPHSAMPLVLATRPLLDPPASTNTTPLVNNNTVQGSGVLDWYAMLEQGEAMQYKNESSDQEDALVTLRATDLALIVYTEGEPRGVMLTHGALVAAVKAYVERLDQLHMCPAPDLIHAATQDSASSAAAAARYTQHYSRKNNNTTNSNSGDDLNLLLGALPACCAADDTESAPHMKGDDEEENGSPRVCRRRHKDGGECEHGAYTITAINNNNKYTPPSPALRTRMRATCGAASVTVAAARSRTNVHLPSYLAHIPLHNMSELMLETCCLLRGFLVCYGHAATLMETSAVRPHGDLHTFRPLFFTAVPATLDALRATVQHTLTTGYSKLFFDVAYETRRQALRRGLDTPFLNQFVFAQPRKLLGGRCRVILSCNAALHPRTQEYLQVVCGASVLQLYTLTELAGCGTMQPYGSDAFDNVGGPLAPTELKLRDVPPRWQHNCAQPAGELLVRSATMMVGYYRQPECGAAALEQSGWLHTGDIASRWPDGSFSLMHRVQPLMTNVTGHVIPVAALEKIYSGHALATTDGVCVLVHPYRPYICALVLTSEARALRFLRAQAPASWLREHIAQWPYCLREKAFNAWAAASLAALAAAEGVPVQERVRHVRVLYDEWSTWNGMRGVTGALQREQIERKYAGVIAELFAEEA